MSRAMPPSASYFVALGAIAATALHDPHRRRGQRTRSRATSASSRRRTAMGARVHDRPELAARCRAAPGRCGPSRSTANAIPDAAMTLARDGALRRRLHTLRNIASWRVKETDRIAAMANELRKIGAEVTAGDDFIEVSPPTASGVRGGDPDLRRPPHGDVPVAGRRSIRWRGARSTPRTYPRSDLRGQDLPRLLRDAVRRDAATQALDIPVITVDGPTASGKGTLAVRPRRPPGLSPADSGPLYRVRGWHSTGTGRRVRLRPPWLASLAPRSAL